MDWLKIAKTYEKEYIDKTSALLKIPTVLEKYEPNNLEQPFGEPIRRALDLMLTTAELDGFKTKNILNYAGHIEMGEGKEIIGVLGHLDVVPTGGKWIQPPFSAYLKDGIIYSRGTMDDKGPTMAAYIAFRMISDAGIKLKKRVRLILGCDEESGMRCIRTYLEHETMPDLGFTPDAEFPIIYGEKGIFSFDITGKETDDLIVSINAGERYNVVPDKCVAILKKDKSKEFAKFLADNQFQGEQNGNTYTVFGTNAHAAWPHLGVNAIFRMAKFLGEQSASPFIRYLNQYYSFDYLGKKLKIDHFDPEMKELTINTAIVRYDNGEFKLGENVRYPRGFEFDKQMASVAAGAKAYGFSYVAKNNSTPLYVSPKDPLVATLYAIYQKYTGDYTTPMLTIGGGTYAKALKKAVAFGPNLPGKPDLAHQSNEFLVVADMLTAAAIYAESIVKLANEY